MKTCRICKKSYYPRTTLQKVCTIECALKDNRAKRSKVQRKQDRQKREDLKTLPQLTREAQRAFNSYIRARDRGKNCISCGAILSDDGLLTGSRIDCGHYRSTGAAGHLRFNTYNANAQCTRCNRQLSGNVVSYRLGLINKIGEERVNRLENNQDVVKWDKNYLRRVKKIFNRRARHIRKLRDQ
jgi:hypothetical protein